MSWEEPEFEPINMSAEIGGYFDDFGDEAPELGAPLKAVPPPELAAAPGGGREP